jgi:hypothetical protein
LGCNWREEGGSEIAFAFGEPNLVVCRVGVGVGYTVGVAHWVSGLHGHGVPTQGRGWRVGSARRIIMLN